jgi:hypothetical protein
MAGSSRSNFPNLDNMEPILLISPSTAGWRIARMTLQGPELREVDSLESLAPGEPILGVPSRSCLPALLENTGTADPEELVYLLEERLPLPAEEFVADFCPAAAGDLFAVAAQRQPLHGLIESLESHGQMIHHACPLSLLALQHLLASPSLDDTDAILWQEGAQIELFLLAAHKLLTWHVFADENAGTLPVYLRAAMLRRPAPLRLTTIGLSEPLLNQLRSIGSLEIITPPGNEDSIHTRATRAARDIAEGRLTPWIDLRRGALAPSDPNRPIRRPLNALVLASILCAICVLGATFLRARHYAGLEADSRRAQEELFRATLPGRPLPPDVRMRLVSEETLLSTTATTSDEAAPGETRLDSPVFPALYALLSRLPDEPRYRFTQIYLGDGQLSLECEVNSHGDADALAAALRTNNAFQTAAPHTELTSHGVLVTINGSIPASRASRKEAQR